MTNSPRTNIELEALLEFIKANRGFDFSGYKRSSLVRRLEKQMQSLGIRQYNDYSEYLEVHPDEYAHLFNTILINVTSFFRDPKAWEYIDQEILPAILNNKRANEQIRIWSAGCASGEETYSIAILLAERLGLDRFKEQVKIYSTDLDEDALVTARQAIYPQVAIESIPAQYAEKYFEITNGRYTFSKELRRSVIFGRHDLIQDAPISRIDLLLCRNVLMYFNAETQTRILSRLSYALNNMGYLFLGKAEMLLTHVNLFSPVNLKHRIFRKAPNLNLRDRLLVMTQNGGIEVSPQMDPHERLRDITFDNGPVAQIILDMNGAVAMANEKARRQFHIDTHDIGQPFQDMELSYRPVELRSTIEQAYTRNDPVVLNEIEMYGGDGEHCYMNIILAPLQMTGTGMLAGISISFQDVSEHKRLRLQLEQANQELETAMEELQSTNEELETTNEELQSTIEELETTNEELQSTNEEMSTMNEELQSNIEELETMNDELGQRSEELNQLNSFLESILTGLRGSVIVLDNQMNVQVWNNKSEDMWGLRANEVINYNILTLDIGLPFEQLKKAIRVVLSGENDTVETSITATNRRGRIINLVVTITPLRTVQKEIRGVILLIEQTGIAGEV